MESGEIVVIFLELHLNKSHKEILELIKPILKTINFRGGNDVCRYLIGSPNHIGWGGLKIFNIQEEFPETFCKEFNKLYK